MMTFIKHRSFLWVCLNGIALGGCGLAATPPVTVTIKPAESAAAETNVASAEATETNTNTAVVPAGGTGDLIGTVLFDGAPTSLPAIVADKDKEVCAAVPIPNESLVVDSATKGVQNVFIFLAKAPAKASPIPAPEKQVFDQVGCKFIPHAMLVRTKVPLMVLSDDAVGHNTHTFPTSNAPFNSGIGAKERVGVKLTYDKSEAKPLNVKCDIHPWMSAYHLPLDHGFADVTKANGEFTIKGLPVGTHQFKVWHEAGDFLDRKYSVTIKPGENKVEIKYGAAKFGK